MNKEEATRAIFGVSRSNDYKELTRLTNSQETAISEVLILTDQLDALYDRSVSSVLFAAAMRKVRDTHDEKHGALPKKDLRTDLLRSTLKAYGDVHTPMENPDAVSLQDSIVETMVAARMRKAFLRKILSNELDSEGHAFLNYLLGDGESNRMGIKIPLPSFTRMPDAKAHPFPIQVSFQTQEFIQGVLFYVMFADVTAGEYVRMPNALNKIQKKLTTEGMSQKAWNDGWTYLEKYKVIFENTVFQNAAIFMRSHWDWYVRQIGEFVQFARNHVPSPTLSQKQQQRLSKIGWKGITDQLSILEDSSGIKFGISTKVLSDLKEMSLVRNLGMHNRWEVDQSYLDKSSSSKLALREVRLIEIGELQSWSSSLSELINATSFQTAVKYVSAPDYTY
ncbi:MAG: hypothetical protein QOJ64_2344 [Acidobacteriota bacterium]|jgi:hypothetical protein|nr:hypothetical protein [Acidobacteriota bacterium]